MEAPMRDPSTPGRRPYGTRPGEAAVLRLIERRRQRGDTWQDVAARLNARGLRTRDGMEWTVVRVSSLARRAIARQTG